MYPCERKKKTLTWHHSLETASKLLSYPAEDIHEPHLDHVQLIHGNSADPLELVGALGDGAWLHDDHHVETFAGEMNTLEMHVLDVIQRQHERLQHKQP